MSTGYPPALPEDSFIPDAIPLAYASGLDVVRRPASATFLGITSICAGVVQLLWASFIVLVAIGLIVDNRKAAAVAGSPKFLQTSLAAPNGLPAVQRQAVVASWTAIASLSRSRSELLEALLAERGMDIVPTLSTGTVTIARAKAPLTWSGTLSSGETYLNLSTGRVELSDVRATFEPIGSTELLSLDFTRQAIHPGKSGFDPSAGAMAGSKAGPNGSMVARSAGRPQVGNVLLAFILIPSAATLPLALVLLTAAVLTLTRRRSGRRMLVWWAWLKLPFALAGCVGVAGLMIEISRNGNARMGRLPTPGVDAFFGSASGILQGVLSVGLIVLVLVIANRPHVRAWFETRA